MGGENVPTLYEWAGGAPVLEKLTEALYAKVLRDDQLHDLFAGMAPDHPHRVAMFLGEVLGGPMSSACGQELRGAKIREFPFHDLRHTFASWYMMSGGDLYELSKLLGHSNIKMTERYAELAQEHIMKTGSVSLRRSPWRDAVDGTDRRPFRIAGPRFLESAERRGLFDAVRVVSVGHDDPGEATDAFDETIQDREKMICNGCARRLERKEAFFVPHIMIPRLVFEAYENQGHLSRWKLLGSPRHLVVGKPLAAPLRLRL